jgi:predicted metal-dependent hydrolase
MDQASTVNWCNDSPAWTNCCHALSILFPAWERAFTVVAAHYKSKVSPELAQRIESFIKEENAHANAHEAYNRRHGLLEAQEQEMTKTAMLYRRPGRKFWLGTMVSIEHLAACMARMYMNRFAGREGRDYKLFEWHSIEELGHKDLAMDVWNERGFSGLDEIVKQNQSYVCTFIIKYVTSKTNWKSPVAIWDFLKWFWVMTWEVFIPMRYILDQGFHPNHIDDTRVLA